MEESLLAIYVCFSYVKGSPTALCRLCYGKLKCKVEEAEDKTNSEWLMSGKQTGPSQLIWSQKCNVCVMLSVFMNIREVACQSPLKRQAAQNRDVP